MMETLMPERSPTSKEFLDCKLFKPYAIDEENYKNQNTTDIFD